ncbi:MAG: MerR family DNA-binding transcriptional regulator [Dehalococcoidia bacterium]
MTIGKLAAVLGLHPDTIRRYERQGLIPAAHRSPFNGYRLWSAEDVALIQQTIFGECQMTEEIPEADARYAPQSRAIPLRAFASTSPDTGSVA